MKKSLDYEFISCMGNAQHILGSLFLSSMEDLGNSQNNQWEHDLWKLQAQDMQCWEDLAFRGLLPPLVLPLQLDAFLIDGQLLIHEML